MKLERYRYQPEPEQSGWLVAYRHPRGRLGVTVVFALHPALRFEPRSGPIALGLSEQLQAGSALEVKAELDDGSCRWFRFELEHRDGERSCAGCRALVHADVEHDVCATPIALYPDVSFSLLPRHWLQIRSRQDHC